MLKFFPEKLNSKIYSSRSLSEKYYLWSYFLYFNYHRKKKNLQDYIVHILKTPLVNDESR